MIRVIALLAMGVLFYLLNKANDGTVVTIKWVDTATAPMALSWVLLYTFLAGAVCYALFTVPERFKTWRALRQHRRSLRKMGKSLDRVISNAKSQHE